MKRSRPAALLVLGIMTLFGIAVFIQKGLHPERLNVFRNQPWDPKLVLKKAVIVGWDHGQRLWAFSGDELYIDHRGQFLTYKGNGIGKLYYNNLPYLMVFAPQISLDLVSKSAQAIHGVRIYAKPKTTIVTDEVLWNQMSQKLFIPGEVSVDSPYGTFSGADLLFSAGEGRLKISNIRIALNVRSDEMAKILREGRLTGAPKSAPVFFNIK